MMAGFGCGQPSAKVWAWGRGLISIKLAAAGSGVLHARQLAAPRQRSANERLRVTFAAISVMQKLKAFRSRPRYRTRRYLRPTTEQVGRAYAEARHYAERMTKQPQALYRGDASSLHNDTETSEPT